MRLDWRVADIRMALPMNQAVEFLKANDYA